MEISDEFVYKLKIEKCEFDIISKDEFYNLIKDGRIGSRFIEMLLPHYFNLHLSKGNAKFDFYKDNLLFDEKTLTKNGLSLTPSSQKGIGRKFNINKFIERNKELSYYIIADVINFPTLEFVFVKTSNINTNISSYSVNRARELFFNGKKYIELNKEF